MEGSFVPTMYAARVQTVALLETAFHDVHQLGVRLISERTQLATRGLVAISVPTRTSLVDLSDAALARVGVDRSQLVATSPQHYACTQAWAIALHERRFGGHLAAGLLWRSRVAELAEADCWCSPTSFGSPGSCTCSSGTESRSKPVTGCPGSIRITTTCPWN